MEIPNDNSSFAEINDYISLLFYHRNQNLLETLLRNPFGEYSIKKLEEKGWKILIEGIQDFEGKVDFGNKIIRVSESLCPYKRDKAISHEILHAFYGKRFNDKNFGLEGLKNNIIVEWTGRRIRASPSLLATIWKTFSITPRIYDRASFLATQKLESSQLLFPSFNQTYNFTLMD